MFKYTQERLEESCTKSVKNENTCKIFHKGTNRNYCCVYCQYREEVPQNETRKMNNV